MWSEGSSDNLTGDILMDLGGPWSGPKPGGGGMGGTADPPMTAALAAATWPPPARCITSGPRASATKLLRAILNAFFLASLAKFFFLSFSRFFLEENFSTLSHFKFCLIRASSTRRNYFTLFYTCHHNLMRTISCLKFTKYLLQKQKKTAFSF